MPTFINDTGVIAATINGLTNNFTGTIYLSLFIIIAAVFLLTALFRIPIEFGILFSLPILIGTAAYIGDFNLLLGTALLMISIILSKYWFFR